MIPFPSPSTVLLPAARTSLLSARTGWRSPRCAAPEAHLKPPLPLPSPGPRTTHPRAPPSSVPKAPLAEPAVPNAPRRAAPGRRASAAGFQRSRRPHTLLPFAASKQLAGALRAAPPSPRRGSAPPRASRPPAPAPPPPTWSVSLSTAILLLLRAHTHTGSRSTDVTPGAGEAEGIARGREKNLAPEFDSPPYAPPPPPLPPPAERLTLASRVCSRARPPLYRKYRLLPAGPPLTSPRAASLAAAPPGRRCLLPPAAAPRSPRAPDARSCSARRRGPRLPPAFRTCTLRPGRAGYRPQGRPGCPHPQTQDVRG